MGKYRYLKCGLVVGVLINTAWSTDLKSVILASQYLNSGISEVGSPKTNCTGLHEGAETSKKIPIKIADDYMAVHSVQSVSEYEQIFKEAPEKAPSKKNPFYISLVFENDKRFGYDQLTQSKSDDVGRTHGVEFHLGHQDTNGMTKDLSLTSHLYTEKIRNVFDEMGNPIRYSKSGEKLKFSHNENGVGVYLDQQGKRVAAADISLKPQHFQEVNTFGLVVDNINQGETIYYRAGVGVIMLVSDKPTSFGAAIQQEKWHQMSNKTVYTNISDGEADRIGLSVLGAIGLQKKLEEKKLDVGIGSLSYQIRSAIGAEINADTISEKSFRAKASIGIGMGREVRPGERTFEISASQEEGKSQLRKFDMSLNGKDCSVFVTYNFYKNEKQKYAPLEEGTAHFGSKCHF